MRRLSKEQAKEHERLSEALRVATENLQNAIAAFNEKQREQFDEMVSPLVDAVNDVLSEARDFRDGVHAEMDGFFSERSEKWQEGDAGSAYSDWMTEWEGASLDDIDVDAPSPLDDPDLECADTFEGLPTEP